MLFGTKTNINPPRIDLAANNSATYEIADCTDALNGIGTVSAVYSYRSGSPDAAEIEEVGGRIDVTSIVTLDPINGRITVPGQAKITQVVPQNYSATIALSPAFTATESFLTLGLYTQTGLATHVAATLGITVSYNTATHKFTLSYGGTELRLLIGSANNDGNTIWSALGFTGHADLVGANTYTGDTAVYTDPDKDLTIRVNATGYLDAAIGLFTGSAAAEITKGPDIARAIWIAWLKQDTASVDASSFAAARTTAPQHLGIYLKDEVSTRDVFDAIERSTGSSISVDGSGVLYFDVDTGSVPSDIVTLENHDYLSFSTTKSTSDIHTTVNVKHNQNPASEAWVTSTSTSAGGTGTRVDHYPALDVETYLLDTGDADDLADSILALAERARRLFTFSVIGRLIGKRIGTKVYLTRARAAGGALQSYDPALVKLMSFSTDPITGIVQCEAIEV
jgi:hypothetical protein